MTATRPPLIPRPVDPDALERMGELADPAQGNAALADEATR